MVLRHPHESRNKHQSVTLLDAIAELELDACIGGARRDEEKARAKERVFSFRDEFGQWDPKNQRPELWNLYNARIHKGENIRAFPISNWTELDVWQYIARERLALPSIYFAHRRAVVRRGGALVPVTDVTPPRPGEARRGGLGPLPHRRRHHLHRAGRVHRRDARGDRRGDRHHHHHRARRDAPRRPDLRRLDGAAQEGGVLLDGAPIPRRPPALPHLRQRRRREEHAHRAAPPRHEVDPRRRAPRHRADLAAARPRGGGPLAPHRRAAGRARAGDHHRRRLPLLLDRHAQVHHRRRARARAVHAQHGDRGLHRAPRRHPGGRAQGRPHADAAPLLPRPPRRHPAPRRRGEQDGPRRLVRGALRGDPRRVPRLRGAARDRRRPLHPDLRARRATWSSSAATNLAWYDGPTLLEILEAAPAAHSERPERSASPSSGSAGRRRPSTTTSAATRAGSSRARCRSATRCSTSPPAGPRA